MEIKVRFHTIQNQVLIVGYLVPHKKQILFEYTPEFIKTGLALSAPYNVIKCDHCLLLGSTYNAQRKRLGFRTKIPMVGTFTVASQPKSPRYHMYSTSVKRSGGTPISAEPAVF